MIPQEKNAAVTHGLREAFGVTEFEDIRMLTKGQTSALVFRIVVRGAPCLLKIVTNTKLTIGPERQYGCMKSAADAGVAPRVHYTSIEDGVSITDFVEETPFPLSAALIRLPRLLRTLHSLPPFPAAENRFNTTCTFLVGNGPARDAFMQRFLAANVLSKSETEEFLGWHAQLAASYVRDERDMVSSHNDLFKPDNTLFDGRRVWLVDWEAAFLNDRYVDLAVVANYLVHSDRDESVFLQEYFGQPPDDYRRARFFLMRQLSHLFYAVAFLLLGSSDPVAGSEPAPDFQSFHRRIWAGELRFTDKAAKAAFGKVHWERFVQNARHARFGEALKIVSERKALS